MKYISWRDNMKFEEIIENADQLYKKGKYEKSLKEYKKALKKKFNSYEIHSKIASINIILRDFEEASKSLKLALKFKPEAYENYFMLGNVYQSMGYIKNAIESYEKYLESIEQDDKGFWVILYSLYVQLDMKEKAKKIYDEKLKEIKYKLENEKNDPETYHQAAILKRFENDHQKALEYLNEAIKLNKNSIYYVEFADSCTHLANLDIEKRKEDKYLKEAVEKLEEGIQNCEDNKKIYESLSNIYMILEEYKKSADTLEILLNKYPSYSDVYIRYHNLLDKNLEDFDRIIKIYGELKEKYPQNPIITYCLMNGYMRKEQNQKAYEIGLKAEKEDYADALIYLSMGHINEIENKNIEAETYYKKSIKENKFFFDSYFKLMIFYNKLKEEEKLKELFKEFKALSPEIKDSTLKKRHDRMIKELKI
jgi:tetratricopeptide (TPR) repeat protein